VVISGLTVFAVADNAAMLVIIHTLLGKVIGVNTVAAMHTDQLAAAIDKQRPDGVVAVAGTDGFPAIVELIHARFSAANSVITVEEDSHGVIAAFKTTALTDGIAGCLQHLSPYLKALATTNVEDEHDLQRLALLTEREREILTLTGGGMSAKQTARHLSRSVSTISRHVANIMRKLQLHDRVTLSLFAVRVGLVVA
jgi:DNA-binding NarL/FixJ family response regulator